MKVSAAGLFFGFELFLLFAALGNCFVPGSWTSFWWTECGWLGSAAAAAAISLAALRDSQKQSVRTFLLAKQSLAFLGTIATVGLLVLTH